MADRRHVLDQTSQERGRLVVVEGPHQTEDVGAAVEERAHGPLDFGVGDDLGHEGESRSAVPVAVGQHGGRKPASPTGEGLVAVDDVPVLDDLA